MKKKYVACFPLHLRFLLRVFVALKLNFKEAELLQPGFQGIRQGNLTVYKIVLTWERQVSLPDTSRWFGPHSSGRSFYQSTRLHIFPIWTPVIAAKVRNYFSVPVGLSMRKCIFTLVSYWELVSLLMAFSMIVLWFQQQESWNSDSK
jgi:hypothetical protein